MRGRSVFLEMKNSEIAKIIYEQKENNGVLMSAALYDRIINGFTYDRLISKYYGNADMSRRQREILIGRICENERKIEAIAASRK